MIDIRQAIKVREMLNRPRCKIGITKKFPGDFPLHKEGEVILFTPNGDGFCTIESPISDEWIERNRSENNGIRTIGTCVGVPLNLIEEILI